MAIEVPNGVQGLFLVLTGEKWPSVNEDELREVGTAWGIAGDRMLNELGPQLLQVVQSIRENFTGKSAIKFAEMMGPYVADPPYYIPQAAEQFAGLRDFLLEAATQVEYVKIISIEELVLLIAQMAWAVAMAYWTAGASLTWLAGRFVVVRVLLQSWWGRLIIQFALAELFGVGFQVALDVLTQAIQFAKHTRTKWDVRSTLSAIEVGAVGGLLTLPFSAIGHVLSQKLTARLSQLLGRKIDISSLEPLAVRVVNEAAQNLGHTPLSTLTKNGTRSLAKDITDGLFKAADKPLKIRLTEIGVPALIEMTEEGLHEVITEGVVMAANGQGFQFNPFSFTSGVAGGITTKLGDGIGNRLAGPRLDDHGYTRLPDTDTDTDTALLTTNSGGTEFGEKDFGEKEPLISPASIRSSSITWPEADSHGDGDSTISTSSTAATSPAGSVKSPSETPPLVPPRNEVRSTSQPPPPVPPKDGKVSPTSVTPGSRPPADGERPARIEPSTTELSTTGPSTTGPSTTGPSTTKASTSAPSPQGRTNTDPSTSGPTPSRSGDRSTGEPTASAGRTGTTRPGSRPGGNGIPSTSSTTQPPATRGTRDRARGESTPSSDPLRSTRPATTTPGTPSDDTNPTEESAVTEQATSATNQSAANQNRADQNAVDPNVRTTPAIRSPGQNPAEGGSPDTDPFSNRTVARTNAAAAFEASAAVLPENLTTNAEFVEATELTGLVPGRHRGRLVVTGPAEVSQVKAAVNRLGIEVVAQVDREQISGRRHRKGHQWMIFPPTGRPRPVTGLELMPVGPAEVSPIGSRVDPGTTAIDTTTGHEEVPSRPQIFEDGTRGSVVDAMADLVGRVNRALAEVGWDEGPVDAAAVQRVLDGVFVSPLTREPADPATAPSDLKGRAVWIAHQISGREFGLKGGSSRSESRHSSPATAGRQLESEARQPDREPSLSEQELPTFGADVAGTTAGEPGPSTQSQRRLAREREWGFHEDEEGPRSSESDTPGYAQAAPTELDETPLPGYSDELAQLTERVNAELKRRRAKARVVSEEQVRVALEDLHDRNPDAAPADLVEPIADFLQGPPKLGSREDRENVDRQRRAASGSGHRTTGSNRRVRLNEEDFNYLIKVLGKENRDELTELSNFLGRVPREIVPLADEWRVPARYIFKLLHRKLRVSPQYLSSIRYLVSRNFFNVKSMGGVGLAEQSNAYDVIHAHLRAYTREIRRRTNLDHLDFRHLLAIAHFADIDLSFDLDELLRFLVFFDARRTRRTAYSDRNTPIGNALEVIFPPGGDSRPGEDTSTLQNVRQVAADWRRYEDRIARPIAVELLGNVRSGSDGPPSDVIRELMSVIQDTEEYQKREHERIKSRDYAVKLAKNHKKWPKDKKRSDANPARIGISSLFRSKGRSAANEGRRDDQPKNITDVNNLPETVANRVLRRFNVSHLPVERNGNCFYEAFQQALIAHYSSAGATASSDTRVAAIARMNSAGMRDQLATDVLDPQIRARVDRQAIQSAFQSWTARSAPHTPWPQQLFRPRPKTATRRVDQNEIWRSIADQIRTDGQWADEGGDLAPYLAALHYNVRIRVVHSDGTEEFIGDENAPTTITLYHPTAHWDATAPRQP